MKYKTILRIAILLVFSCMILSCVPEDYPSGEDGGNGSGSLYGWVSDLATGDPVEGALVTLSPGGMEVYTGNDGHFEFLDLDALQYVVTVQKTGYNTNRKTVILGHGGVVSVIIALQANN